MRSAELDIKEEEVALAVLNGLPTDYNMTVTLLAGQPEALQFDDVVRHLLRAEQLMTLQAGEEPGGTQALVTKGNPKTKQL